MAGTGGLWDIMAWRGTASQIQMHHRGVIRCQTFWLLSSPISSPKYQIQSKFFFLIPNSKLVAETIIPGDTDLITTFSLIIYISIEDDTYAKTFYNPQWTQYNPLYLIFHTQNYYQVQVWLPFKKFMNIPHEFCLRPDLRNHLVHKLIQAMCTTPYLRPRSSIPWFPTLGWWRETIMM